MAWENIKENIKTLAKESLGLYELKQQKPWSDQKCLNFYIKGSRPSAHWRFFAAAVKQPQRLLQ